MTRGSYHIYNTKGSTISGGNRRNQLVAPLRRRTTTPPLPSLALHPLLHHLKMKLDHVQQGQSAAAHGNHACQITDQYVPSCSTTSFNLGVNRRVEAQRTGYEPSSSISIFTSPPPPSSSSSSSSSSPSLCASSSDALSNEGSSTCSQRFIRIGSVPAWDGRKGVKQWRTVQVHRATTGTKKKYFSLQMKRGTDGKLHEVSQSKPSFVFLSGIPPSEEQRRAEWRTQRPQDLMWHARLVRYFNGEEYTYSPSRRRHHHHHHHHRMSGCKTSSTGTPSEQLNQRRGKKRTRQTNEKEIDDQRTKPTSAAPLYEHRERMRRVFQQRQRDARCCQALGKHSDSHLRTISKEGCNAETLMDTRTKQDFPHKRTHPNLRTASYNLTKTAVSVTAQPWMTSPPMSAKDPSGGESNSQGRYNTPRNQDGNLSTPNESYSSPIQNEQPQQYLWQNEYQSQLKTIPFRRTESIVNNIAVSKVSSTGQSIG